MFFVKVKAGALQLTILITVVISLLLMTFVLLVQTHKKTQLQTNAILETVQDANKGIQYSLNTPTLPVRDTVTIQGSPTLKHVRVHRDFWGVFERVSSVATIKKNTFEKSALIGGRSPKTNRMALYLQNNYTPLVVVGTTKIEGEVYLPEQGVKPGTISGKSYYGSELIYGNIKKSGKLPQITPEVISQLKTLPKQISTLKEHLFLPLKEGETYENSFLKPTKVFFSTKEIQLKMLQAKGNFIVQSNTKIVVESSAVLKDVLLIAPIIEIKNQVKGRFQAIATNTISVGKKVTLNYPSALVVHEKETTKNNVFQQNTSPLYIDTHSTIKGLIVYLGAAENNYRSQILLTEDTTIYGEVYCNQNLELKGTIYGTVYAKNCVANEFGSMYQNHMYNGTILANNLSEKYIGLLLKDTKKGILQWLY